MASEATNLVARIAAGVVLAVLPISLAYAQSPAEFYKGRLVDMQIGYSVGGGYDLYARLLARHLGKHIAGNPTVVPKNMEGAASLRLANWLFAAAPKDGSVIGAMSRGAAFDQLLGNKGAQFLDASKFAWLGSANDEVSVCIALKSSGVTKFDDVLTKELTIGSNGVGDDTYQFPAVMNAALGTKFKIVTGYPGGNDITLALERSEVQGRCGWSWSSIKATRMDWVGTKMNVIVQMSLSKHPDLPNVPLIMDLAKNDEQRQIFKLVFARQVMGRPYALPPGVPKDRVEALRQAFAETMADKEFLAEAEHAKFEITPVTGDKIEALVAEIYQTPPEVVKKAAAMLQ
jgi:tripartite-type tricarboxylate transporter receptor subunit TctC